ncbi:MAG: transketolase [Acetivibrionales bacterium]|jgi:transketolase
MSIYSTEELTSKARQLRIELIDMLYEAQSGHPGGSLSEIEILIALYYEIMNVQAEEPFKKERDRFILSKGHAAPGLYVVLADKGYFPKGELKHLRQLGSILQGHPCMDKTPGIDFSSGSLGQGLSAGIGMALASRIDGIDNRVYVLLGDGELNEGQVWEAVMFAAKMKLDNIIAIVDYNRVQLDGTADEIMPMDPLSAKWESFNWNVIEVDGHDVEEVINALRKAKEYKGKPSVIIANTVKGKGVSFMENKHQWHGKPISKEEYIMARQELMK